MSNATNLISNKHPDSCPALVLNADFRPLSYYPLSLWSWQDAIKAVFLDRVNIVSSYDRAGTDVQDECKRRKNFPSQIKQMNS